MIFSKFRRCFYSYTAELLNRPKGFWKRFYIEQFFIFAYGYSRGVYGGYIMLASSPQTRATFLSVDYSLALLHQFDALMILLLWFFGLFFHYCEVTLARLELTERDGNSSDMWRLLESAVIGQQDHYFGCLLEPAKRAAILQKRERQISTNLSKWRILFWLGLDAKSRLISLVAKLTARICVFKTLENLDRRAFYRRQLLPNLLLSNVSNWLKRKMVLMMLVADRATFGLHLIISEFCHNFFKNKSFLFFI